MRGPLACVETIKIPPPGARQSEIHKYTNTQMWRSRSQSVSRTEREPTASDQVHKIHISLFSAVAVHTHTRMCTINTHGVHIASIAKYIT